MNFPYDMSQLPDYLKFMIGVGMGIVPIVGYYLYESATNKIEKYREKLTRPFNL